MTVLFCRDAVLPHADNRVPHKDFLFGVHNSLSLPPAGAPSAGMRTITRMAAAAWRSSRVHVARPGWGSCSCSAPARGLATSLTSGLADKIAINGARVLDDLHTLRGFGAADAKYRDARGGDGNPKGADYEMRALSPPL